MYVCVFGSIFGNQFPENGAFGCDGKYYFPEILFLLTEI